MTNPVQPIVIKRQSFAERIQPQLNLLLNALQTQRQQQLYEQQMQNQVMMQERSQALGLLTQGLQQPGFANTDVAKQLENKIGLPGFSKEFEKLRTAANRQQAKQFEEYLEGIDVDDQTKQGLRAVFVAKQLNPDTPAEVITDLYRRIAPEAPLSALDKARLAEIQASTRRIIQQIGADRIKNPTPADQRAIADALGIPFMPGINYAEIFEAIQKREPDDPPSDIAIRVAMQLAMATDISGMRTIFTPEQAVKMGADIVSSLTPGVVIEPEFPPEMGAALEALQQGQTIWLGLLSEGAKEKDIESQVREWIMSKYGPFLTRERVNDILQRIKSAARK